MTIYKNGKDKSNMSGEIPQITYIKIDWLIDLFTD